MLTRLKSVDFFRKLPSDLTEATLTGGSLSILSTFVMVMLLMMEFSSFLTVKTDTQLVLDKSPPGELLRITFNISFTEMTCEHLTLDVSDQLGSKKINLSKTVRKTPISASGARAVSATRDEALPMPLYDDHNATEIADVDVSVALTAAQFASAIESYPLVVINFYAPWCPWCQRLAPTWETVMRQVHEKYPESDGRIRIGKVDCVAEMDLCRNQKISGFPTIRVYRQGSDKVVVNGMNEHESYHGDRTVDALTAFVDTLVPTAGKPGARLPNTRRMTLGEGCQMSGFVLVKKVPGTMHFHMKQDGTSFDHSDIDVSHSVHQFMYGNRPSPKRLRTLARLHPGGLEADWADKLQGRVYRSVKPEETHEHYMQLVLTTVQPVRGGRLSAYDAYEYTVHSHSYVSDYAGTPAAKFTYQTSAMQVVVLELSRQWYHFLTTTCAIIGGVFTVCGILDGVSYSAYRVMKKVDLGKQG